MTDRKYSVREIDELRQTVEIKWLTGSYAPTSFENQIIGSYREDERARCIEERVRTFMLAGITAQDLSDSENPPQTQRVSRR